MWIKLATAGNGKYGVWYQLDEEGKRVHRIQKSPIIPQGEAGYYNLNEYLKLHGVKLDEEITK